MSRLSPSDVFMLLLIHVNIKIYKACVCLTWTRLRLNDSVSSRQENWDSPFLNTEHTQKRWLILGWWFASHNQSLLLMLWRFTSLLGTKYNIPTTWSKINFRLRFSRTAKLTLNTKTPSILSLSCSPTEWLWLERICCQTVVRVPLCLPSAGSLAVITLLKH